MNIKFGIFIEPIFISFQNIVLSNGSYSFDLSINSKLYQNFNFNYPGKHNLSNALAALIIAFKLNCKIEDLKLALLSFKGVQRRYSFHINSKDLVYIDDYAHHPEEISAIYDSLVESYPNENYLVAFQPHLYSRTRDFMDEFAEILSKFDNIILTEIYPAREKPITNISSDKLLELIDNKNKSILHKSDLSNSLKESDSEVFIIMGAGDIAGGGDTLAAVDKYEIADQVSYISTGGGAFLEYVEGKELPAVALLKTRASSD